MRYFRPPMRLKDKIAIVTGGARGIGFGCAKELAKEGAAILLADRPGSQELAGAADEIRSLYGKCVSVEADAFTRSGCESVLTAALENYGRVDVLVSVPAYNRRASFLEYDGEVFEGILKSALLGGFHMSQLVSRHLVETGRPGRIVFISSILGEIPNARCVAYSAAKAGLNMMSRTMAVELFQHRINVNVIEPGWIDTPGERDHYTDETMAEEAKKLPWGRMGTGEDIGKAAVYLCSDDADYVTGTTLPVDGGYRFRQCIDIAKEG